MTTERMLEKLSQSEDPITRYEVNRIKKGHREPQSESKRELIKFVLKGDLKEALMIAGKNDFVALMKSN